MLPDNEWMRRLVLSNLTLSVILGCLILSGWSDRLLFACAAPVTQGGTGTITNGDRYPSSYLTPAAPTTHMQQGEHVKEKAQFVLVPRSIDEPAIGNVATPDLPTLTGEISGVPSICYLILYPQDKVSFGNMLSRLKCRELTLEELERLKP